MKQPLKNEIDVASLINKIEAQLIVLDKKLDTLLASKPSVNKERMTHTAICADCKKECTIPFKPRPDRPVYCQDCFSRRKVIRLSGLKIEAKPKEVAPAQAPIIKKTKAKKKSLPKKK